MPKFSASSDIRTNSKLSTLRESRNDNISMIVSNTPGFGVRIMKELTLMKE